MTVEILQSVEAVRIFYSLQCQTRKKHGLPPQPFKFFLNIHKHILSQKWEWWFWRAIMAGRLRLGLF